MLFYDASHFRLLLMLIEHKMRRCCYAMPALSLYAAMLDLRDDY